MASHVSDNKALFPVAQIPSKAFYKSPITQIFSIAPSEGRLHNCQVNILMSFSRIVFSRFLESL